MPLVYAAIVPHSPVLLPTIGKEHCEKLAATLEGLSAIQARIKELKPDTIVIIAGQDQSKPRRQFCLHVAQKYRATFAEFGDLATTLDFESDPVLASQIKQGLAEEGFQTVYASEEKLDYGVGVPLFHIIKGFSPKIIVINPADAVSLKKHFDLGSELRAIFQKSEKRIICIASGDLSHCIHGETDVCTLFDQDFLALLKAQKTKKILATPLHTIHEIGACGMTSFVTLLGVVEHMHATQSLISYEAPLGVGNLVMEYTV